MIVAKIEKNKRVLHFVCSGRITHEDYQKVVIPAVEKEIEKGGMIRVFCDLRDMKSIQCKAARDDFRFGRKHSKDFERFATVGDQWWVGFLMKLSQPFFKGKLKHFKSRQYDEAQEWINQKKKG